MQKQLNEQIQQLSQSGKTGRALSQELAKMAAQQQMLRQAMQRMDRNQPGQGKPGGAGQGSQGQGGEGGQPGSQAGKNGTQPGAKPGENGQPGGKDGKGKAGDGGQGDLKKLMEQTETDLVNKRLTEQTLIRQQQILTRMLEVEKSARERDQDSKREAQTGQAKPPGFPPAFEKYQPARQRATELLRTTPPALTPYYQREVGEYFQKMR